MYIALGFGCGQRSLNCPSFDSSHINIHFYISALDHARKFKGPIPSVLVFLFTMLIKCLCLLGLIFIVKPQYLHVLLGEMRQQISVICNSLFNNQMELLFNINNLT